MTKYPKAFSYCRDDRALHIFYETLHEAIDLGFHFHKSIDSIDLFVVPNSYWNGRRLGECRMFRYKDSSIVSDVYIVLNKTCINNASDMDLRALIIHEVAHATKEAAFDNHGKIWENVGNTIGAKYGIKVTKLCDLKTTEQLDSDMFKVKKLAPKYSVRCPKCNHVWEFSRMCNTIKNPEKYRCGSCKVKLERIK